MTDDDLDRIFSREDSITPSSGFTTGVMNAVRREASVPPPIPFPWKRALPAFAAGSIALTALVIVTVLQFGRGVAFSTAPWAPWLVKIVETAIGFGAGWIAVALLITLASVRLSMRLASGRS